MPNANAPSVSITAPAASAEVAFTAGVSNDLAVTVSVAIGDAALSTLLYVYANSTKGTQKTYTDSSPDNGANSHTFTIASGECANNDVATVTIYILDGNYMHGSHSHAFTWKAAT
jgi:hypothetical protein